MEIQEGRGKGSVHTTRLLRAALAALELATASTATLLDDTKAKGEGQVERGKSASVSQRVTPVCGCKYMCMCMCMFM